MHKMRVSYLAVVSALSLAACSEQGSIAGPTGPISRARNSDVIGIASGGSATICSSAATLVSRSGGAFGPVYVPASVPSQWHAPVSGSIWVVPFAGAEVNAPNFEIDTYETSFSVPTGNTAVISGGSSYADNQVLYVKVDNAGTSLGANAGLYDAGNYGTTALNWSTSGTIAAGTHTLDVQVENNDSVQPTDPSGVTFCYTVTATPVVTTDRGCSPGYWKNHDNWPSPYTKSTVFSSVFGSTGNATLDALTFQQVLELKGGGLQALMRLTVSALLNAQSFGAVHYGESAANVITDFHAAIVSGDYTTLANKFTNMQDGIDGRLCVFPSVS
jgi:hypothetical protein